MPRDLSSPGAGSSDRNHRSKGRSPKINLTLEFSKAADYNRINTLFSPSVKNKIDPQGYVVKRAEPAFKKAINGGAAVMLSDKHKNVQSLTMAYRVNDTHTPNSSQHDYTEVGSSLSRLPGFGSAKLIVAALALKEWWNTPAKSATVAEIKFKNIPSIKTYKDRLGWEKLTDRKLGARIYDATDTTLVNDKDKSGHKSKTKKAESYWYYCSDKAIATQARMILEFMKQGGLMNKRTGEHIPVDFTALEKEGLTTSRLKAIAGGETSRKILRNLPGPGL